MTSARVITVQPISIKDWSLPAANLADLIAADGPGRFLQVSSPPQLSCRRPMLLDRSSERTLFLARGELKPWHDYPLPDVRLDVVPHARLVGEKCVVVSHDDKVFAESYWSTEHLNDGRHFQRPASSQHPLGPVLFRDGPAVRKIDGPAMLLGNPWASNYHHWVINCLGRLWWTDHVPELRNVPVIVPSPMSDFQRASLTALGVSPDRILPFNGGVWHVKQLYFPANGDFQPEQLHWLRKRLQQHFGVVEAAGSRRLYISRADASGRQIVNEQEVAEFLTRRGFEILLLGAMPLREQVQAFANAGVVIGPHGSGLTNMLFGPRHQQIIELHPADEMNHVFWVLANALQHPYAFLSGKPMNAQRDFIVDLADLETIFGMLA